MALSNAERQRRFRQRRKAERDATRREIGEAGERLADSMARPRQGAAPESVFDAIRVLADAYRPGEVVKHYWDGDPTARDRGLLLGEHLPQAAAWLAEFHELWQARQAAENSDSS